MKTSENLVPFCRAPSGLSVLTLEHFGRDPKKNGSVVVVIDGRCRRKFGTDTEAR